MSDRTETFEDFAWMTAEEAVMDAQAERARHAAGKRPTRAQRDERAAMAALYPASGRVTAATQQCPINEKQPAALTRPGCVTEP